MTASISAVIPYFNSSNTLARALDSVFRQSFPVREIVVVDDGSRLEDRIRAEQIVAQYANARLIVLEANAGPAEARNVGWDNASSDWIAFLDSDDAWHPRKLEILMSAAANARALPDLLASRTIQVEAYAEFARVEIPEKLPSRWIRTRDLIVRNRFSTPAVVVRRGLRERFQSGRRFSEDYELWLTLAGHGRRLLFVDAPLAAIFKAPYGASGLSAQIFSMIWGEYRAYVGAWRARALEPSLMCLGLLGSTLRSCVRLMRLSLGSFGRRR